MLGFLLTRLPTGAGPVQPLTGSISITSGALSPAAPNAAPTAPDPRSPALRATFDDVPSSSSSPAGIDSSASSWHSLHLLLWRWCWQMLAPPHSLHVLLMRWCWQMLAPPHSLHWLLMRWCGQTLRGFLRAAPPAVSASSRLRRLLAPSQAAATSEFSARSSSDAALPLSLASIFLPDLLLPGSWLTGDQRKLLARTQPKFVWLPWALWMPTLPRNTHSKVQSPCLRPSKASSLCRDFVLKVSSR